MRALFGQCRTPETATRGTHSRTPARGTPPPCLSCFACLPLLSVHNISLCADLCGGGISPGARGTFSVRFTGKNQPNPSCSSHNTLVPRQKYYTRIILKPIVPTVIIKRIQLKLSCSRSKTAGVYNPKLAFFVLLDYGH